MRKVLANKKTGVLKKNSCLTSKGCQRAQVHKFFVAKLKCYSLKEV